MIAKCCSKPKVPIVFINLRSGIDFQLHLSVEMWLIQLTHISYGLIYQLCIVYVTHLGHERWLEMCWCMWWHLFLSIYRFLCGRKRPRGWVFWSADAIVSDARVQQKCLSFKASGTIFQKLTWTVNNMDCEYFQNYFTLIQHEKETYYWKRICTKIVSIYRL